MNQLYPLKFNPIYKSRIWGGTRLRDQLNKQNAPADCGESWEISAVAESVSVVSNGFLAGNDLPELIEVYMGDLVGDAVYEKFGNEFPLLVKLIDANEKLSVQVHPDDFLAFEKHSTYGKTEMWYVLDAIPGAQNITGLKKGTNSAELLKRLENKTLDEILVSETVEKGDVFFIPSGRVHATGKGILFAEIQQTSDITYRLYDYNRLDAKGQPRELHVGNALEAIDFTQNGSAKTRINQTLNEPNLLVACPYFTTNLLTLDKPLIRDYVGLDSFVIYLCTNGSCKLFCDELPEGHILQTGETMLIPALIHEVRIHPTEGTVTILEIFIDEKQE
jgi:mannose-6-phosphate isomerase